MDEMSKLLTKIKVSISMHGTSLIIASMEQLCFEAVKKSLEAIRKGFYKVVPLNLITIFEPY